MTTLPECGGECNRRRRPRWLAGRPGRAGLPGLIGGAIGGSITGSIGVLAIGPRGTGPQIVLSSSNSVQVQYVKMTGL